MMSLTIDLQRKFSFLTKFLIWLEEWKLIWSKMIQQLGKNFLSVILVISISCKVPFRDEQLSNAKWFYYAFAIEQKGFLSNGLEVDPLSCGITLNSRDQINRDTTKYFFSLYNQDTLNQCTLKPVQIVGIVSVKNQLFIPIYHYITYDTESDDVLQSQMERQDSILQQRILQRGPFIDSWLRIQAKRRKSNDLE